MAELRLGVVGCDTGHVVEFTRRLLHRDVPEEQWVEGATVVAAWPGSSAIAPDRLPGYVEALRGYGVAMVDQPEELAGGVWRLDGILVEAQEGASHRSLVLPFLQAGLPVFVDKPFACSTADAAAMVEMALRRRVPLLSASSLRFAPEVVAARAEAGAVHGAATASPGMQHPRNPGLFHYGVHGVEMLYALMGPGCATVSAVTLATADHVTGLWKDGRLGTVRAARAGSHGYACMVWGEKRLVCTPVATRFIYRELLRVILGVFAGEPSPVSAQELVEAVAFQEAALQSASAQGASVRLAVV